ncbi:nuclear transport factor 2 family protein [uncultured Phenylobacterium sp.]|uniref:nuclear transport factor 2 family protein n=1 Tax=uncultured Phenylobacterium sp. TaxID=349273 RepID=UPI0025DC2DE1|nr:nuclear transport factor 2 family protein [uncultured Phenylobacterium sp.]
MSTTLDLSPAVRRDIADACERLVLDYAHFADHGQMEDWAKLFAEDGELHLFGQVHKGRKAIQGAIGGGAAPSSTPGSMHVTTNFRLDVASETEASATAYVAAYVKAPGAAAGSVTPVAVGIYRDRYRRTAEGWRFAQRAFEPFAMPS